MGTVPHWAFQLLKSASVTPRAREQAPQENTGMRLSTTFAMVSLSGGHPMGLIVSTVASRIRYAASWVRNICTSWPASASATPWENTKDARVGSSVPQELLIKMCSFLFGAAGGCV